MVGPQVFKGIVAQSSLHYSLSSSVGINQPKALLPEGELILGGDPREDRGAAGVDSPSG